MVARSEAALGAAGFPFVAVASFLEAFAVVDHSSAAVVEALLEPFAVEEHSSVVAAT